MRTHALARFAVAAAALMVMFVFAATASAAGNGAISGHVTDSVTGNPIQGICVSAYPSGSSSSPPPSPTHTDANGNYTFASLDNATDYVVSFSGCTDFSVNPPRDTSNYASQYYDGKSNPSDADPVTTNADSTAATADAQMVAGGSISGHVTDTAATPNPLGQVCVYAVDAATGTPSGNGYTQSPGSPDPGAYTIEGLAPGTNKYKVFFQPCGGGNYLTEWWNNQHDAPSANSVSVAGNADTPNVNAALEPGAVISGNVTKAGVSAPDNKLKGMCVYVSPANGTPGMFGGSGGSATTDANGHYQVQGLAAGDYKVQFNGCQTTDYSTNPPTPTDTRDYITQWYNGAASFQTAGSVHVDGGQTRTDIGADMVLGGSITGHAYSGSGTATPLQNICVSAAPADGSPYGTTFSPFGSSMEAVTDATGSYTIRGLAPGSYKVRYDDCSSFGFPGSGASTEYATEYFDNEVDFRSADPVDVQGGQTTSQSGGHPIDGHLGAAGSISGTVTHNGQALPYACVSAYSTAATDGADQFSPLRTADADENGQYQLAGLAEGNYKLRFYDCDSGSAATEYSNDKADLNSADAVGVTSGADHGSVNADLGDGATISGSVTNNAATPVGEGGVCVVALDSSGNVIDGAQSYGDGYYISGLRAGTYKVKFFTDGCPFTYRSFQTQFWNGKSTLAAADPVTLTAGQDATGIDAHMVPGGGSISGHVTGGTPSGNLAGVCVQASPINDYGFAEYIGYGSAYVETAADGTYTIDGLQAGNYDVSFASCGDSNDYLPEYWQNASDLSSATPVDVHDGQTHSGVDAQLAEAGRISGHVKDSDGKPIDAICVDAYDASTHDYIGGGYTDTDGSYTVHGLDAGSYKLEFSDCDFGSGWATEWYADKADFASADTLAVTAGAATPANDTVLAKSDTTPPDTTFTSGPVAGSTSASRAQQFAFSSSEQGSTFECQLDGAGWEPCDSPLTESDLADHQSHTFQVRATDHAHNTDATPAARTWTVDSSSTGPSTTQGDAGPGGTVSTNPDGGEPTPSDPVALAVQTPNGGSVTIAEQPTSTTPSPTGFTVFGSQLTITAPAASVASPLRITFTIDASAIPTGTNKNTLTVTRDGSAAADCLGSATANPDPCITARSVLASGDVRLTVLSSHASTWNFAKAESTGGGGGGGGGGGNTPPPADTTPTTTTQTPTNSTPATTTTTTQTPQVSGSPTPAATKCKVPKLVGLTLAKAKKALTKAHCALGKVTKKKGKKSKKGKVVSQKLKPGTVKAAGTKVAVVVGK